MTLKQTLKQTLERLGRAVAIAWHAPLTLLAALVPDQAALTADVRRWRIENGWRLRWRKAAGGTPSGDGSGPAEDYRFSWVDFLDLAARQPIFRNLLYFRAGKGGMGAQILLAIARRLYPPDGLLFLDASCTIGGGLYIQHGFSTIVNADLGEQCWINQQVTIGFKDASGRPRLGNQVRVSAGAKVLGPIVVGENVAIGANAVVVKNVPPNCTVVGVPAYIVRRDGQRVRQELA